MDFFIIFKKPIYDQFTNTQAVNKLDNPFFKDFTRLSKEFKDKLLAGRQLVADKNMDSVSELDDNAYVLEGEEMKANELYQKVGIGKKAAGIKMAQHYSIGSARNIHMKVDKSRVNNRNNIPLEEGEDWGVELPEIRVPESGKLIFPQETDQRRIVFSSNECPLSNSNWIEFHQSIKGEYKDVEFDFSVTDPRLRKPKHLKPILGLQKDLGPGMK